MRDFNKIISFIIFLLCCFITLNAQDIENLQYMKPRHLKKMAKSTEGLGDVYSAIPYYEVYCKKVPKDEAMLQAFGEVLYRARHYNKAIEIFSKAYELDTRNNTLALFYRAKVKMMLGLYEEAIEDFKTFNKAHRGRFDKKWVKYMIEGCEMGLKSQDVLYEPNADIYHLDTSINNANIEFSPQFIDEDKLVYGSLKTNGIQYYNNDLAQIDFPVRKFYMAERKDDTVWNSMGEFTGGFNSAIEHTGNGALSDDGLRFYFTRCKQGWDNKVLCEIYRSTKQENGQWGEPERLGDEVNMPGYTATQPAIGRESKRNKEVLYFVTDRPRGRGGLDIWYSIYEPRDSVFTKARNAGTRINSTLDEMTPFYDPTTRSLYFSSEYWPGYGGLDVFRVVGEQSKWTKVKNIGAPINSSFDDLYYTTNPYNKLEGMIVSNREGSVSVLHPNCCDDIFAFNKTNLVQLVIRGTVYESDLKPDSLFWKSAAVISLLTDSMPSGEMIIDTSLSNIFSVKDSVAPQPTISNTPLETEEITEDVLADASVMVYLIDKEEEEPLYLFTKKSDENGNYIFDLEPNEVYQVVYKKDGYFNRNAEITTKQLYKSDTIDFQAVILDPVPRDPIKFNIYYGINAADVNEESAKLIDTTLLVKLIETPDLIVEISSHTDNTGDSLYNKDLSQRRAQAVVDYLITKGIDKRRLIAVGYGQRKPIADNTTVEGQALNRRTEVKVIGSVDQFSKLNSTNLEIIKKNDDVILFE